jgi:hypothetical protein
METNQKERSTFQYVKPSTKKHKPIDIVKGSGGGYSLYYTYYYTYYYYY